MAAINGGIPINWSKVLFNIFKDMVTTGSRKSKGFVIQISLLLEDVPNLELGDSSEFPSSRILTDRTVHSYIVINDKVGMEEVADISRVKKTPKKKAVSRKRPAVVIDVELAVNKKRTSKSKSVSSKDNLDILPVAQEAVPLQTVAPTMEDEPVVESTTEEVRTTSADDVDIIIEKVIAETAQLEMDEGEPDVSKTDVGAQETRRTDETDQWFNLSFEELYAADRPIETANVYIATEPVEEVEMAADEQSAIIVQDRSVATVFDSVVHSSPVLLLTDSSSVFDNEEDQMDMDHRSDSPDLSHDYSMHFVEDDIHLQDDSAPDQFILPSSTTAISASLAALRESFSNLVANQSRDSRKTSDDHSEVMCKINHVERVFLDSLAEQNETFREMLEQEAAVVKVGEEVIRVDQRENDPVVVVSRQFVLMGSIQMLKPSVVGTSHCEVFRNVIFINLQKGNNSDVKTISQ
ncbi:large subunit GTPase 1 [Dorcoceras hygrometricum]|uniref:Large subunit GTPase 1 n=1 Tax=Dorcoceras hygrometricum TaxID=472368 RepID=A0A2Z7CDJ5_9LAMI|nr:large subunit GTPase 1 [Dorcoceras hygrometricum]